MGYTGVRYVVKEGDTLWDIAAKKLGDPYAWPKIYVFNNQKDVIAAGAKKISDPDLIYAGSVMMLPIPPGTPQNPAASAARPPATRSLKDQIPSIRMPVRFAYDIKSEPLVFDYGSFVARVRQKGRVMIDLGAPLPLTLVLNGGIEVSSQIQAQNVFTTLASENKVTFDPNTKGVTFSNKLISSATNVPGPKTEVAIETSSASGIPVLKVAIAYPEIKGKIGIHNYVALDYKVEVEIEPRIPRLQPAPVPIRVPVSSPARVPQIDWGDVLHRSSNNVLIVAGVVTVLYGASVVFSGGTTSAAAPAYASVMAVILVGATTTTTVTVKN